MGKQNDKLKKAFRYRKEMQHSDLCRDDTEVAMLELKYHPERMQSDNRRKAKDNWQSDFDQRIRKYTR